ncbi:MAG: hypothetical protein ACREFW_10030, partial [Rhizomicrobium sp.]
MRLGLTLAAALAPALAAGLAAGLLAAAVLVSADAVADPAGPGLASRVKAVGPKLDPIFTQFMRDNHVPGLVY